MRAAADKAARMQVRLSCCLKPLRMDWRCCRWLERRGRGRSGQQAPATPATALASEGIRAGGGGVGLTVPETTCNAPLAPVSHSLGARTALQDLSPIPPGHFTLGPG